jgi:hypothetical protein
MPTGKCPPCSGTRKRVDAELIVAREAAEEAREAADRSRQLSIYDEFYLLRALLMVT